MAKKSDKAERLARADLPERIKTFAQRVRPNYDARRVTKTEWDEACGDTLTAEVDALEAKTAFPALLDRVEKGEEIVITRKGQAVARLVRVERESTVKERRAAIERISRLAAKRTLKSFSSKTLRDGRKY